MFVQQPHMNISCIALFITPSAMPHRAQIWRVKKMELPPREICTFVFLPLKWEKKNQTSDASGELTYIVEISSIFIIDGNGGGGAHVCVCAACVGSSLSQSKTRKVGVCCSWLPHLIHALIQFFYFFFRWEGGEFQGRTWKNKTQQRKKLK